MISEISEGTDPGSQDTVRASKEASDPQLEIQVVTPENLANLRHELRGPINHIIGYSEMLEEEVRDLGKEDFIPDLQRIQVALQAGLHATAIPGVSCFPSPMTFWTKVQSKMTG